MYFIYPLLLVIVSSVWYSAKAQSYQQYSYKQIDSIKQAWSHENTSEQTLLLFKTARQKAKQELGDQHEQYGKYTAWLGGAYTDLANFEEAEALLTEALPILENQLGSQHLLVADALQHLGYLYSEWGDFELALDYFNRALNIREQVLPPKDPSLIATLGKLADLHENLDNLEWSVELYTRAIAIAKLHFGEQSYEAGELYNSLAVTYYRLGEREKALTFLHQTQAIYDKTIGQQHSQYASMLNNMALIYTDLGQLQKALAQYLQAKAIDEALLGKNHPDASTTLLNIAYVYHDLMDYENALNYYLQAKAIDEKALGKDHPDFALLLNNLAFLYKDMGEMEQALRLCKQAKDIHEKVYGKEHLEYISSALLLARFHTTAKNYEQALPLLAEATQQITGVQEPLKIDEQWQQQILSNTYSNRDIDVLQMIMVGLNDLLLEDKSIAQRLEKSTIVASTMFQLLKRWHLNITNEEDKLYVLGLSSKWIRGILKVLQKSNGTAEEAFYWMDVDKSVLLLQATQAEATYQLSDLPDTLIQQQKLLLEERDELQALLLEASSEEEANQWRTDLVNVLEEVRKFEQGIKKDYPKYYQLTYQNKAIQAKTVQAQLDEKTALIEYLVGDSAAFVIYIDQNTIEWQIIPISAQLLTRRNSTFYKSLINYNTIVDNPDKAYKNYTRHAHWFYQQLLAPVLQGKEHLQSLIIIPDHLLGSLPFECFLTQEAPQQVTPYNQLPFLLHQYNFSYNYSAALWLENQADGKHKRQNNGQMLGVAADYEWGAAFAEMNQTTTDSKRSRGRLAPLPNAQEEVKTLQQLFQGRFLFQDQASEKVVKQAVEDYAVLHFATHSILELHRPMLSSIALTPTQDSTENNFWQAHEIAKMDLQADLVVLSACETGYGAYQAGNGIASLARSFMYAGAPSLVVSLWQVNDYATSAIMERFYQNLQQNMPKDVALRQAKLDYLQSYQGQLAHPAFWSAFIQMGNTQAISLAPRRSFVVGGIGIGISLLLLCIFGVYYYKKKPQ